jgi:O-methyltransferase involved in polyketide biosynthesis
MNNLSGVSETLLLTLYARYLETKRPDGILRDEKAIEIVENLDADFSKFANDELSQLGISIRSEIIDEQTKAFLERNPNSQIVNIAAGLCTRFFRVKLNGMP